MLILLASITSVQLSPHDIFAHIPVVVAANKVKRVANTKPITHGHNALFFQLQTDLSNRAVGEGEARLWAESRGFHYFESSSSSGLSGRCPHIDHAR
jgi:hypothetical protein